jgi:hypothetical protein
MSGNGTPDLFGGSPRATHRNQEDKGSRAKEIPGGLGSDDN